MILELAQLIDCGVAPTPARTMLEPLREAFDRFDISTPARIAGFLGQACHESAGMTQLEELLSYRDPERIVRIFRTAFDLDHDREIDPEEVEFAKQFVREPQKLANRAYANRNGNGDEASGDGWRFRGSGVLHLTGRGNFARCDDFLRLGYVANPDRVREPAGAAMSGAWFWTAHGLNLIADAGDVDAVTRIINPAMLGAAERRAFAGHALEVLA